MNIADIVIHLVDDLPIDIVSRIAYLLCEERNLDWDHLDFILSNAVSQVHIRNRVHTFISEWKDISKPPKPNEMGHLLEGISLALIYQRRKQKIDLIWTGPVSPYISLRRNDQALLELINSAQSRILIVSFIVYKARSILSAIERATNRGVEIIIILESPDVSEGKIAYNSLKELGTALREESKIFIWPAVKRPTTPDGKIGSLHAKIAVADGKIVYLSSANLTDFAMTVNMEMGILLRDPYIATSIENHFYDLIAQQVLMEVEREG